jgi:hypothetical protein
VARLGFFLNYCISVHGARLATAILRAGVRIRDRKFAMAKKKKMKRFRAVTAVKELARERLGAPPAEKIVVEKKKKPEKHKPTLGKLLEEN